MFTAYFTSQDSVIWSLCCFFSACKETFLRSLLSTKSGPPLFYFTVYTHFFDKDTLFAHFNPDHIEIIEKKELKRFSLWLVYIIFPNSSVSTPALFSLRPKYSPFNFRNRDSTLVHLEEVVSVFLEFKVTRNFLW